LILGFALWGIPVLLAGLVDGVVMVVVVDEVVSLWRSDIEMGVVGGMQVFGGGCGQLFVLMRTEMAVFEVQAVCSSCPFEFCLWRSSGLVDFHYPLRRDGVYIRFDVLVCVRGSELHVVLYCFGVAVFLTAAGLARLFVTNLVSAGLFN
jgi:hypothetical protein